MSKIAGGYAKQVVRYVCQFTDTEQLCWCHISILQMCTGTTSMGSRVSIAIKHSKDTPHWTRKSNCKNFFNIFSHSKTQTHTVYVNA
jgi:hypothetical protein